MANFAPAPFPVPIPGFTVPAAPATFESVPPREDSPMVTVLARGEALATLPICKLAAAKRNNWRSEAADPGSVPLCQPSTPPAIFTFPELPSNATPRRAPAAIIHRRDPEPEKSTAMPDVVFVEVHNMHAVFEAGPINGTVLVTDTPALSVKSGRDVPPPPALAIALELRITTVGEDVNAEHRARMSVKLAVLNCQVLAVVAELTAVVELAGVPLMATQTLLESVSDSPSLDASNWTVAVNAPESWIVELPTSEASNLSSTHDPGTHAALATVSVPTEAFCAIAAAVSSSNTIRSLFKPVSSRNKTGPPRREVSPR
jgi:hypothetical protein